MQFWTVDTLKSHTLADHDQGEEISPGVVVERRTILRLGLSAAGLAAVGGLGLGSCAADSRSKARSATSRVKSSANADEFVAPVMPQARANWRSGDSGEFSIFSRVPAETRRRGLRLVCV